MRIALALAVGLVGCSEVSAEEQVTASSAITEPTAGCSMTEADARGRGFTVQDLQLGEVGVPNASPNALVLFNHTGAHLQLDSVAAVPSPTWISSGARDRWAEFCVHLDDYSITGQPHLGVGEVGCMFKLASESAYPVLRWGSDAQPTALEVAPDSCVVIGGGAGYDFRVTTSRATQALYSARQPIIDHVFDCAGADQTQSTPWSPWKNESSRTMQLVGATIYAASPTDENVAAACVYVLDEQNEIRTRYCSPDYALATRGEVTLPRTEIPPGWSVAAQASHACDLPSFRHWGWAGWLHVF